MMGAGLYCNSLVQENETLMQRIASLDSLNVRSQEALALIHAHREDFSRFRQYRFEETLTPDMIKPPAHYRMDLGTFAAFENEGGNKGFGAQNVIFFISCMNDREVYALIDRLITKGPGLFHIREIRLSRVNNLTGSFLEKVATGISSSLIEGQVLATWIHR